MVILSEGGLGHRAKSGGFAQNTDFASYILLIFALRLGLSLKVVLLDVKLNFLSNGGVLKDGHLTKIVDFIPNTVFFTL
jgi:hypothetical protein